MFEKLLSSFSIGSAKVDTRLEKTSYVPGEQMRGQVLVFGGEQPEKIIDIYIRFITEYVKYPNSQRYHLNSCLSCYKITPTFFIQPKEIKEFPFIVAIPLTAPLTMFTQRVYINITLDIESFAYTKNSDSIEIRPLILMEKVLYGMEYLGFYLVSAYCEYDTELARNCEFIQKIRFNPGKDYLKTKIDKIDIIFLFSPPNQINVVLNVDKNLGAFFQELFKEDKTRLYFQISTADAQKPVEYFAGLITNAINTVINARQK